MRAQLRGIYKFDLYIYQAIEELFVKKCNSKSVKKSIIKNLFTYSNSLYFIETYTYTYYITYTYTYYIITYTYMYILHITYTYYILHNFVHTHAHTFLIQIIVDVFMFWCNILWRKFY